MSCTIPTIPCVTGPVIGGISDMYIIRSRDVLAVPDCCCEDNHTISDPLTIRNSAEFVHIEFRPGTARYAYTQRDTEHGPLFEIEVTFAFRKLSPELDTAVSRLAFGHYVLIFTDHNGYRRLAGSPDSPMRLLANGTTGARRADTNAGDWKFSGQGKCPVCYLDTDIPFPNTTDSLVPPDSRFGNFDDGRFELNDTGLGQVGANGGSFEGMVSATGGIYDEQGQSVAPGEDLKIEIDLVNAETGESTWGAVEIPYTADINFATTNATGGPGMTMWNVLKAVLFQGGTGAHSQDPDATGRFDFFLRKETWANISPQKYDTDSVDVILSMRVADRLVWSERNELRFPQFIRPTGNRLHISEWMKALITPSSSGGAYSKDRLTLNFNPSVSAYFSEVAGTFSVNIDGNTQTGDITDAWAVSPVAGNGGITAITGTLQAPVVTFSNDSAHSVPVTLSWDVTDGESVLTMAQKFYIVRDDLDTDPYLVQCHFDTNTEVIFSPEDIVSENGKQVRLKTGFLVESGTAGSYTQVAGAYSERYGFTQQADDTVFEYAWLDVDVYEMVAFEATATMSGIVAPDITADDTVYNTCAIRLSTT